MARAKHVSDRRGVVRLEVIFVGLPLKNLRLFARLLQVVLRLAALIKVSLVPKLTLGSLRAIRHLLRGAVTLTCGLQRLY